MNMWPGLYPLNIPLGKMCVNVFRFDAALQKILVHQGWQETWNRQHIYSVQQSEEHHFLKMLFN